MIEAVDVLHEVRCDTPVAVVVAGVEKAV